MKKLNLLKIVQLTLWAVLSLVCLYILLRPSVRSAIFASREFVALFALVWIILILMFVFLLLDFAFMSNIKTNYKNLYSATYADQTSGLPNRFSCDVMIDKYSDKPLPADMSCVMIELSTLYNVNSLYGRAAGNKLLESFAGILSTSAVSLCFVGRNGGNKFLAIFEDGSREDVETFLDRVKTKCDKYNSLTPDRPIRYAYGCAYNSELHEKNIIDLISKSNSLMYDNQI